MDCDKKEALRAKGIAEKKMESKDFVGARTIALKAQKLYPDLENITPMLVVCDVHCSAEQKSVGNSEVVDWYKVLQVDRNDNDIIITKQYKKFARQLHPDKNKFAGAEAAFKLIGEAQRVLLDREKRSSLDMNLSSFSMSRTAMPSHHRRSFPVNFNPVMFPNLNPQQQQPSRQPSQQGVNGGVSPPTFWTRCSFCSVKFKYYRAVMNISLSCQQCNKPFIAYEVDPHSTKPATVSSEKPSGQQNNTPNIGAFKVGVGSQGHVFAKRCNKESLHQKDSTSNVSVKSNGKRKRENVSDDDPELQQPLEQEKENGSQHSDGGNNEETEMNDQNDGLKDDQKKEVKQKQTFCSEDSLKNVDMKIKEVGGKETVGSSKIDEPSEQSDSKSSNHSDEFVYPYPEFNDFDKDKKEECFASGQIWAVYDDLEDGMPRFYAVIKKVFSTEFKLQITWLEADSDDENQPKWIEKLPSACGKYKLGTTVTTKDLPMFSHQILCEKISHSTFKVYPRKGETWALFKNWDIKWYMDEISHQKYDLEFVEILSDFVEGAGVIVAYLAKLKGFVSLYSRIKEGSNRPFLILPAELFRFSHRVPSFKMTGQERGGVPVGSYELDPLSLPMEEIAASDDLEVKVASTAKDNLDRSNSVEKKKDPIDHMNDVSAPSASVADSFQVPDPSFYQFDAERSHEKFETGQIWAFYGGEDKLPKYYGQIKEVKRVGQIIELQVIHLTDCWLPKKVIRWDDEDMIISCGRFKVKRTGKLCTYSNSNSASHQVHANPIRKRNQYEIYPRRGEIWALYRGWTTKLKCSDLKNCEYDIVEVIEDSDLWIVVLFLEKVSGYSSVFKCKLRTGGSKMIMMIDRTELLRFSHKILAFKLTEEHDRNLKGFWELDPGAIPVHYLKKE